MPPYWRVEPSDVNVLVGMRARLDCLAFGVPKTVMHWEKAIQEAGNSGGFRNSNFELHNFSCSLWFEALQRQRDRKRERERERGSKFSH